MKYSDFIDSIADLAQQRGDTAVLDALSRVVFTNKVPTMATNATNIFVNPMWIDELTSEEVLGVLWHELLHDLYGHHSASWAHYDRNSGVSQGEWHELANIAMDIVINDVVRDAGYSLPKEGAFRETLEIPVELKTSHAIFKRLLADYKSKKNEQAMQQAMQQLQQQQRNNQAVANEKQQKPSKNGFPAGSPQASDSDDDDGQGSTSSSLGSGSSSQSKQKQQEELDKQKQELENEKAQLEKEKEELAKKQEALDKQSDDGTECDSDDGEGEGDIAKAKQQEELDKQKQELAEKEKALAEKEKELEEKQKELDKQQESSAAGVGDDSDGDDDEEYDDGEYDEDYDDEGGSDGEGDSDDSAGNPQKNRAPDSSGKSDMTDKGKVDAPDRNTESNENAADDEEGDSFDDGPTLDEIREQLSQIVGDILTQKLNQVERAPSTYKEPLPPLQSWVDMVFETTGRYLAMMSRDRTYQRPGRRPAFGLPGSELLTPMKGSRPGDYKPRVCFYVDVSGSMYSGGDVPNEIRAELEKHMSLLRDTRSVVIPFNSELLQPMEIDMLIPYIGGGTSMYKVVEHINSNEFEVSVIVTDCDTSFSVDDLDRNKMVIVVTNQPRYVRGDTTRQNIRVIGVDRF